ncbi:Aminoglycoside phosphotransferase [Paraburkholderia piptadeniae]|uniref:Aminoglycoside phosphotransferase n=1 Tax=Paraburkholderia piptadeniae TaxID=1701573 RepID=A0A1N7SE15_9BURK|nr:phosphotransferase [Paraburkholderia piptadeniae]SIT45636.1 Aminoglycoside phosphotransferase [Paraburkholderia piptadeniae]
MKADAASDIDCTTSFSASNRFEGTRQVGAGLFDLASLDRFIAAHVPNYEGAVSIAQFNGGQSNPTYKLSGSKYNWVLRTKPGPVSQLLPTAHAIEREYLVQSALGTTGFPVPKMLTLCEDESVIGRAFYLMEHLDGRVLWEQSLPTKTPAERSAIYAEMNSVIAALHTTDYRAIGLQGFGRENGFLERQIKRWSAQYRASEIQPIAEMDALIEWLPRNVPSFSRTAIVHGDYRLDNLVFDHQAPRVIGVLDWELSTLGDPAADFAYHCVGFHSDPMMFRGIAGLDLAQLGIPSEAEYVALYERRTGIDCGEHWNFYMAFSLFKIAAILQGVAKRASEGIASSEHAHDIGAKARVRAAEGWAVANELRL